MAILKLVEQSVYFPAFPKTLYNLYLNAKSHAAFTGMPVKLTPKPGGKFSAFGGQLAGTFLTLIPDHLIVQRWRSTSWKKTEADSILTITFHPEKTGCRIHLVHINVPTHDFKGVTQGWEKYYWKPLRAYLKAHESIK
jgi:activator of HSP90 ATPase